MIKIEGGTEKVLAALAMQLGTLLGLDHRGPPTAPVLKEWLKLIGI